MTTDESIMDSWLLYTWILKIPGESLKKSVHGLAAFIGNRFVNSEHILILTDNMQDVDL